MPLSTFSRRSARAPEMTALGHFRPISAALPIGFFRFAPRSGHLAKA
jgi:hypothetical protein